tara:strand:- start:67088 stop:68608 length:1521 start_codon:yes stop_codon:yes gene_type:complete
MKFFLSNSIVSLVLLFSVACSTSKNVALPISSDSNEAIELYKEAWYYWDQNEGLKGWRLMEEALALDPDFILANLYMPSNDPNLWQAYRDKAEANSINGNDYEKMAVKMWKASREGRSMDYINLCKELVSKYPNSADAYVILGDAYTGINDFDNAIANYRKALDLNPKNYQAWNGLALHHVTVGNNTMLPKEKQSKELALQYANGLVKSRPNAPYSYQIKGNIERQHNDMEAARGHYQQMVEVAEKTQATSLGAGYNLIAHTYLFSDAYVQARENYQKAASISPNKYSKISYGEFGVWSYLFERDYEGAVRAATELDRQVDAEDFSANEVLGYKAANQFTTFIAHAHNKNKQDAYNAMRANFRLREKSLSLNTKKDDISIRNYNTFNAWIESWYHVLFNDTENAQMTLEKLYALVKDMQNPDALDGYNALSGMLSLSSGDTEKAVSHFDGIEKENNVYYAYFKGLALEKAGKKNDAQKIFKFLSNWNFQGWESALIRGLAQDKVSG